MPISEGETKKYRGGGRVSFLAHLENFKKEIQEGWPIQAVYERHTDKLDISYPQFVRYVRRYITGPVSEPVQPNTKLEKAIQTSNPITSKSVKTSLTDSTPLPDSELF